MTIGSTAFVKAACHERTNGDLVRLLVSQDGTVAHRSFRLHFSAGAMTPSPSSGTEMRQEAPRTGRESSQ